MEPKLLKIIGTAKVEGIEDAVWTVWFDPETQTPYEHRDGHWIPLDAATPEIQTLIDQEASYTLRLELRSPGRPTLVVHLDTREDLQDQLIDFLNEKSWPDYAGERIEFSITPLDGEPL